MNGINRLQFLGRQAALFGAAFFLTLILAPSIGDPDEAAVLVQFAAIPFNVYWCLQRCLDIGWSRWFVLLLLVPVVGLLFLLAMFAWPPGKQKLELVRQ